MEVQYYSIVPNEHVIQLTGRKKTPGKYGKTAWSLIRHDHQVKVEWLKWEFLLKNGMNIKDAVNYDKSLMNHHRNRFKDCGTISEVLRRLENLGFKLDTAEQLLKLANDFKDSNSILRFCEEIDTRLTAKNNSVEYWINRGFSTDEAKILRSDFCRRGPAATKNRCEVDPEYQRWFVGTRLPGVLANNQSSLMERSISEELKSRGIHHERKTTRVNRSSILFQKYNRQWFVHDFYIPEFNIIAEYNGVYWHQDMRFELDKADYLVTEEDVCYRVMWEGDFASPAEYVDWLLESIGEQRFLSTRTSDLISFVKFKQEKIKLSEYDLAFLDVADRLAELSKCQSKHVCAVAVRDGRIIGTGINGSTNGAMNCCDVFPNGVTTENRAEHRAWSAINEVHAEENLIADAAKRGVALKGSTVYVNLQPCPKCSSLLPMVGVERIVYRNAYDFGDSDFSRELFKLNNIEYQQK